MRILEVVGLTKRFGGRSRARWVSFTAEEGQILALFGPRGAGKTTCAHCLSGVVTPDSGRIIFDGREITGGDRRIDLARAGLARTFQVAKVFPRLTAADNVAVGLGTHRFPRLAWCCARGDAHPGARRRSPSSPGPAWPMSPTRPAGLLPLGMQKRLEIARALAGRPRLILLDEPFGGLSHGETGAMTELIATLRGEGLTVVLIEHRMEAAMGLADRAVVLDRGIVIASGAPKRVRSDPKVIEAYLREDARATAERGRPSASWRLGCTLNVSDYASRAAFGRRLAAGPFSCSSGFSPTGS